jgi:2-polyprenyl-3-methyl-5-hydroxy-6-metoxy-1,4-benzoquinol methylase
MKDSRAHRVEDQQRHPIVQTSGFDSVEEFVLYLIHLRAYEEAARLLRGKSILDWGCNDGYGIEVMQRMGCAMIAGLDVSPNAIESAKVRLGSNCALHLYDGYTLPVEGGSFDAVTSFQCIEHVADCDRFLSHVNGVLKPGGMALFTTPNALVRLDPGMRPWNEFHVREYAPSELAQVLSRYFAQVDVQGLYGTDPVQAVELDRCARAREKGRRGLADATPALVRTARRVIPKSIRRLLKGRGRGTTLPPYSTADLFYKKGEIECALDLLAVCVKTPSVQGWKPS